MIETQTQTQTNSTGETRPLHPVLRAIGEPVGVPIRIGEADWHLAHGGATPVLDLFRDRIDDSRRLKGEVDLLDVYEVARVCLLTNYELAEGEIIDLLLSVDDATLVTAALEALFGESNPSRTYSDWVRASLIANGLDPATIPAGFVPTVLDYLVKLGRAIPASKYTDAGLAAPKYREFQDKLAALAKARDKADKDTAALASSLQPEAVATS